MPPTVRFVDTDEIGLPLKRKQAPHACTNCRKKKKRCFHLSGDHDKGEEEVYLDQRPRSTSTERLPPAKTHRLNQADISIGTDSADNDGGEPAPTSRFIGDLDPQVLFYEAMSPDSTRDCSNRGGVGIFLSASGASKSDKAVQPSSSSSSAPPKHAARGSGSSPLLTATLASLVLPHVHAVCLNVLPPPADYQRLEHIFYEKIHPLFPVIPRSLVPRASSSPRDSSSSSSKPDPATVLYKQAICLAAATDACALPHLRLRGVPDESGQQRRPLLARQAFVAHLTSALHLALSLDTALVPDRIALIRVRSLVALLVQPGSADEAADLAPGYHARAVLHVETLGLHLTGYGHRAAGRAPPQSVNRPVAGATGGGGDEPNPATTPRAIETLFLAVWALDRLNAAFYGRPCLLHERDMRQDIPHGIKRQEPCFRLFLSIVQLLDKVIDLYRPTRDMPEAKSIEMDIPTYEAMILDAGAASIASPLIAQMEIFYHAVIVLACRLPPIPAPSSASATYTTAAQLMSHLPPPSANARRILAAERITQVLAVEFAGCTTFQSSLPLLPFIPYALSLSLSVAYRKIRHTQTRVPMFLSRARTNFATNCALLRRIGNEGGIWSAKVLAGMAERLLREMDRAVERMQGGQGQGAAAEAKGTTTGHPSGGDEAAATAGLGIAAAPTGGTDAGQATTTTAADGLAPGPGPGMWLLPSDPPSQDTSFKASHLQPTGLPNGDASPPLTTSPTGTTTTAAATALALDAPALGTAMLSPPPGSSSSASPYQDAPQRRGQHTPPGGGSSISNRSAANDYDYDAGYAYPPPGHYGRPQAPMLLLRAPPQTDWMAALAVGTGGEEAEGGGGHGAAGGRGAGVGTTDAPRAGGGGGGGGLSTAAAAAEWNLFDHLPEGFDLGAVDWALLEGAWGGMGCPGGGEVDLGGGGGGGPLSAGGFGAMGGAAVAGGGGGGAWARWDADAGATSAASANGSDAVHGARRGTDVEALE